MRFRNFDNLRVFGVVARHLNFSRAAEELCLTKGAISYQIKRLEEELGFLVFIRQPGGITLTEKGKKLWHASQAAFQQLEQDIVQLREDDNTRITIGTTTYFASRWLSPRLMNFITTYPQISLRIQPMIDLFNLRADNIDMAIRWGKGDWQDARTELLFHCPAIVTAGSSIASHMLEQGLENTLPQTRLLHDSEDSTAWEEWFTTAGFTYHSTQPKLVLPDPNVRVQAVIDGQGIALNDELVANELSNGHLFQVSPVRLEDYGYFLAYPATALNNPVLRDFRDWMLEEAGLHVFWH